jgi:hypothetical protein
MYIYIYTYLPQREGSGLVWGFHAIPCWGCARQKEYTRATVFTSLAMRKCVCVCVREIEEDGSTARSACHPYIDDEAVSR